MVLPLLIACGAPEPIEVSPPLASDPAPVPQQVGTRHLSTDGYTACTVDLEGEAHCRTHNWGGPPPPPDEDPNLEGPPGPLTEAYPYGPCGLSDGRLVCAAASWPDDVETLQAHPQRLASAFVGFNGSGAYAIGIDEATGALDAWGDVPDFVPSHVEGMFTSVSVGVQGLCALEAEGVSCWSALPGLAENAPQGDFVSVVTGWQSACALDDAGVITCWGEEPAEPLPLDRVGGAATALGDGYALVGGDAVSLSDGYTFELLGPGGASVERFVSSGWLLCAAYEGYAEPYCMRDPRQIPPP